MLKDANQNFWQLASIQGAALGLQGMVIGEQLALHYGLGIAITSLCIGNLILWIIGLSMFSMTYKGKGNAKHAIENVLTYFGKPIAIIAALILMIAFISWFPVQIDAQMDFTKKILGLNTTANQVIAIIFSLIIIGVSTLGIKAIKWVCTFALPLMFVYVFYALILGSNEKIPFLEWGVSFKGIILVVVIVFPGVINLPTFFRHARSRPDGILGLTLMTFFVIAFQAGTIWMQLSSGKSLLYTPYTPEIGWTFNLLTSISFVALSTFCVNLVNIYFASAALELAVPNLADARGYALIGLMGILAFGFLKSEAIVNYLQTLTNNFIGCMGAILLVGYLSRIVIAHRHRHFEKCINILCWLFGCLVSFFVFYLKKQIVESFLAGIFSCFLAFLCIIFIEETTWSIREIYFKVKRK